MTNSRANRHWLTVPFTNTAGILIVGAVMLMHTLPYFKYDVDDLFISLTYSRNLAHGLGMSYSGGTVVEGYSNFLWVMILAPAVGEEPARLVWVSKALGVLISLVTLLVTWRVSRRLIGDPLQAFLPVCLLVASPWFVFWSVSGLETSLFTLLVLVALILSTYFEQSIRGSLLAGCTFALVAMTRPEGVLFFAMAALWRLRVIWRRRVPAWSCLLGLSFGFLMIYTPYFLWRLDYYGYLFPNTVYAKAGGSLLRQMLRGVQYLYRWSTIPFSFLCLLIPLLIWRQLSSPARYLAVNACAYLGFIVLSGGDWMPFHRFFVPLLPVLSVLLIVGLRTVYLTAGLKSPTIYLTAFALVALFVLSSFDALFVSKSIAQEIGADDFRNGPPGWVVWLQKNATPDERIAVVDAGAVAYYTELEVVDMYGLLDEHIAHLPSQYPTNPLQPAYNYAFGKWDNDYVLRLKPDYIQMHISCEQYERGELYTQWRGTDDLIQTRDFRTMYECVDAPDVKGLFRRKASDT